MNQWTCVPQQNLHKVLELNDKSTTILHPSKIPRNEKLEKLGMTIYMKSCTSTDDIK